MRVMILGSDGYIGYSLALHLLKQQHEVFGIDNFSRRQRVSDLNSDSLTPIATSVARRQYLRTVFKPYYLGDVNLTLGADDPNYLRSILFDVQPDAIVHLAEQPSAPWSMVDAYNASITQQENIIGTLHLLWAMKEECHNAHLVKLGTMGEYGTPNCDIPEGKIPERCLANPDYFVYDTDTDCEAECPMSGLLFPRTPGSFYHLTKVHDTYNVHFACRNWGLRSTDIMQGVLFGLNDFEHPAEMTRFDYDEHFGTAINRFVAQALIGMPLTVYGEGNQTRGFLTLNDALQCINIALSKPPGLGEYRTWNQFESLHSINSLAEMVKIGSAELGLKCEIDHLSNPRLEAENHYYNPDHRTLFNLGFKPTTDIQAQITKLIAQLEPFKSRINPAVIRPKTDWRR